MSVQDNFERILRRYEEIGAKLNEGSAGAEIGALSRELSELEPTVQAIRRWRAKDSEREGLLAIVADASADHDLRAMATDELRSVESELDVGEKEIRVSLLPKDVGDEGGAILEIRAGTGGDEAALFAGDLLRMYLKYAAAHGWKVEILSESEGTAGGYKEVVAEVTGKNVYARLKFESGVHRVQRVPQTETQGRIHTSAATVAVLPEVTDVDITINESDLRIETMRAQGAGGQHVNKTESAIRLTHIPTGIVVMMQEERSQHRNRQKAMALLQARVSDLENQRLDAERAKERKDQIGSGDRSQRIRTYNFPQGRLTDHRVNLTLYSLDQIIQGVGLDEVVDALSADRQARLLANQDDA